MKADPQHSRSYNKNLPTLQKKNFPTVSSLATGRLLTLDQDLSLIDFKGY
jgi:hypothetical protein